MIAIRGNSGSEDCEESLQTIPASRRACCSETPYSVLAQPALPWPLQPSAALSTLCLGTNAYDHYPKIPQVSNSGTVCQMRESRVLRTFSELAGCSCTQLTLLPSLTMLRLFLILLRHRAKLACSFSKLLLSERVPLPRWQHLHPNAGPVSHLFVISRLTSVGREHYRKLAGF